MNGLGLDGYDHQKGCFLGENIHGLMVRKPDGGDGLREDFTQIERCLIRNFSGDGIHFNWIWVFNIRHSAIMNNCGYAARILGYDGLITDNWIMSSRKGGIGADRFSASLTITGNRFDHNRVAGVTLRDGNSVNLTGNYFDGNWGPGVLLREVRNFAITGNLFHRNGSDPPDGDGPLGCHLYVDGAQGLVATGNTMKAWHHDKDPHGRHFPMYGIVLRRLADSIVKDNVLHQGAVQELVLDLGSHGKNAIITDNVGSIPAQGNGEPPAAADREDGATE